MGKQIGRSGRVPLSNNATPSPAGIPIPEQNAQNKPISCGFGWTRPTPDGLAWHHCHLNPGHTGRTHECASGVSRLVPA